MLIEFLVLEFNFKILLFFVADAVKLSKVYSVTIVKHVKLRILQLYRSCEGSLNSLLSDWNQYIIFYRSFIGQTKRHFIKQIYLFQAYIHFVLVTHTQGIFQSLDSLIFAVDSDVQRCEVFIRKGRGGTGLTVCLANYSYVKSWAELLHLYLADAFCKSKCPAGVAGVSVGCIYSTIRCALIMLITIRLLNFVS